MLRARAHFNRRKKGGGGGGGEVESAACKQSTFHIVHHNTIQGNRAWLWEGSRRTSRVGGAGRRRETPSLRSGWGDLLERKHQHEDAAALVKDHKRGRGRSSTTCAHVYYLLLLLLLRTRFHHGRRRGRDDAPHPGGGGARSHAEVGMRKRRTKKKKKSCAVRALSKWVRPPPEEI